MDLQLLRESGVVMEAIRIEFEPFIDEEERQFIVSGVDNFNIAATRLPDYFRSTSCCAASAATFSAGFSASCGVAGCM